MLARWTLRPRLMGVEGVANVAVWGMRDQQIQVQVDPDAPARQGRHAAARSSGPPATRRSSRRSATSRPRCPAPAASSRRRSSACRCATSSTRSPTPRSSARSPVEGTDGKLRLTDVANVVEDHQPLIGDAVVNDERRPAARRREVARRQHAKAVSEGVEDALEKLAPGLSGLQTDTSVFRPGELRRRGRPTTSPRRSIIGVAAARARARRRAHALAHAARRARRRSRPRSSPARSCSTCSARRSTRSRSPAWRSRSRSSSTTP